MKLSEAIAVLSGYMKVYGDIPIVGGYMSDDRPPKHFTLVDDDGCDVAHNGNKPTGVFIE